MPQKVKNPKGGAARATSAPKPSAVMYYLHVFTAVLYAYISQSLIGRLRTLYEYLQGRFARGILRTGLGSRRKRHDRLLFRVRLALAATIEKSLLCRTGARLRRALLYCSLNTYAIFCFFFGSFTVVAYLLAQYFGNAVPFSHLVTGICMIALALPLFFSDRPACRVLGGSVFFRFLLVNVCGIPAEKLDGVAGEEQTAHDGEEHYITSLILAVTLAVLCALLPVPPYAIPVLALLLLAVQLVLIYPEIGLLAVAFFAPLLTLFSSLRPTVMLLCAVGVTMLGFIFKVICGKRVFRMELLDVSVVALGVLYLLGGVITRGDSASLLSALTYTALLLCYFPAANLLRTPAWIRRITGALILSCVIVVMLGLSQYFFADLGLQYLDPSLFSDLGGRVYSTMENPNMLAEYLVLLLPLLLALTITQKRVLHGFGMLAVLLVTTLCLILTWSRGAWLGALVCLLIFLLLLGHRSLSYLTLFALPAAALLQYLPEQITRRFGSIGSLSDSSIRYRVYLWEGVSDMLRDYWFCGVGVGESAFCEVYSRYALPGIGTAVHSHSLYLQLLCELGVVGLLLFLSVVLLFFCYALSYITGQGERHGRIVVLGCLCGISALLLMGLTDHVFYNYRVFLLFWLLIGLCVAQIRVGRDQLLRDEMPHMYIGAAGDAMSRV